MLRQRCQIAAERDPAVRLACPRVDRGGGHDIAAIGLAVDARTALPGAGHGAHAGAGMTIEHLVAAASRCRHVCPGQQAIGDELAHRGDSVRRVHVDHRDARKYPGADGEQPVGVQAQHLLHAGYVERPGVKPVAGEALARLHLRWGRVLHAAPLAVRERHLRVGQHEHQPAEGHVVPRSAQFLGHCIHADRLPLRRRGIGTRYWPHLSSCRHRKAIPIAALSSTESQPRMVSRSESRRAPFSFTACTVRPASHRHPGPAGRSCRRP